MKKVLSIIIFIVLVIIVYILFKAILSPVTGVQKSKMKLTSPDFLDNQTLPAKYTCQGEGGSPPLYISEIPKGTISLALVLKDSDAPTSPFIHWVVWNITPTITSILEGTLPEGSTVGANSVGKNFYFSPCPPQGQHRYIFYLYALDTALTLPTEAGAKELEQIMVGHILGSTTLTGIFP